MNPSPIPTSLIPPLSSPLHFTPNDMCSPYLQTLSLLVLPDVIRVWIHLLEHGLSISVQLSLTTVVINGEWILGHELLPHTYWDFVCLFLKQVLCI